jgi:hypothetical protein
MEDKNDFEMSEEDKLFFFGQGYEGNIKMPQPLDSLDDDAVAKNYEMLKERFAETPLVFDPDKVVSVDSPNESLEKEAYEKWFENYQQERRRIIDEINHRLEKTNLSENSDFIAARDAILAEADEKSREFLKDLEHEKAMLDMDALIEQMDRPHLTPEQEEFYRKASRYSTESPVMDDRDRVINDLLDGRKGTK